MFTDIGSLAGGLYDLLLDCIDQNPGLLAILEAEILNALQEAIDNGIINTDTPGEGEHPVAIHTNNPMFGMELHYFDGNGKLEAKGRYNGNISWME